jgi:hypothetical protein
MEMENFKLRAQPFNAPELYQSAYGIVLALSVAVAGRLVTSLHITYETVFHLIILALILAMYHL